MKIIQIIIDKDKESTIIGLGDDGSGILHTDVLED